MLDLIPSKQPSDIIKRRYLEPACGNGNFLVEILRRKLEQVNTKFSRSPLKAYEFNVARTLTTIYGIDICEENVIEARERLYMMTKLAIDMNRGSYLSSDGFFALIKYILCKNIIVGDTISDADSIRIVEFLARGRSFEQRTYSLGDLMRPHPLPLSISASEHFLKIGAKYTAALGLKLAPQILFEGI